MWGREIVRFEEVKWRADKSLKCAGGCGKRLKRSITFSQTINPFNKLPDGTVKDRPDIYKELKQEAEAWKTEPVTCDRCLISQATGKLCD